MLLEVIVHFDAKPLSHFRNNQLVHEIAVRLVNEQVRFLLENGRAAINELAELVTEVLLCCNLLQGGKNLLIALEVRLHV